MTQAPSNRINLLFFLQFFFIQHQTIITPDDEISQKLPKEILLRTFSYLDVISLCRCAQVRYNLYPLNLTPPIYCCLYSFFYIPTNNDVIPSFRLHSFMCFTFLIKSDSRESRSTRATETKNNNKKYKEKTKQLNWIKLKSTKIKKKNDNETSLTTAE